MNKTLRLSKSGIEYLDYVWNFYSGCHNKKLGICLVQNCWAEAITKRMKHNYPNGFEPTFYPEAFLSPLHLKKPSIIGCAFMGDLFGDWVDPWSEIILRDDRGATCYEGSLRDRVFMTVEACPQHTFLFKTKCPQNLPQWSPFPDNCFVGISATNPEQFAEALVALEGIQAEVKYISFEPLLKHIPMVRQLSLDSIDWVIIGAQTKPTVYPNPRWVHEIIVACREVGIPYFLKDNLAGCLTKEPPYYHPVTHKLRQEMPGGEGK